MKLGFRFLASALACLYLLSPAALVFAQTSGPAAIGTPPASRAPQPVCTMTVSPTNISAGGAVTLTWQSSNATGGDITSVGSVGPSGSINLLPSSATQTTFVGTFVGPGGTTQCQATVTVSSGGGGGGTDTGNGGAQTQTQITQAPAATTPAPVSTQTTVNPCNGGAGLVPCGCGGFNSGTSGNDQTSSTGCQACNLAQLVQLLINFCIGLSIPIAAALFAYAGVLYFTSAERPGNKDKAKKIFQNAFIGFIIAITGWLVINTLLHALLDGGRLFQSGSWFTVECANQVRPVNTSINDVLGSLPILNAPGQLAPYTGATGGGSLTTGSLGNGSTGGSGGGAVDPNTGAFVSNPSAGLDGTCAKGTYYYTDGLGGGQCFNSPDGSGDSVAATSYPAGSASGNIAGGTAQWASQLNAICAQVSYSDCAMAQATMIGESGGKAGLVGPTGDYGLMQVTCGAAQTFDSSGFAKSNSCDVVAQKLLTDPTYNMTVGVAELQYCQGLFPGDVANQSACYNGGPKADSASTNCPGQTAWQCQVNSGYQATRNYVPGVVANRNKILGTQ